MYINNTTTANERQVLKQTEVGSFLRPQKEAWEWDGVTFIANQYLQNKYHIHVQKDLTMWLCDVEAEDTDTLRLPVKQAYLASKPQIIQHIEVNHLEDHTHTTLYFVHALLYSADGEPHPVNTVHWSRERSTRKVREYLTDTFAELPEVDDVLDVRSVPLLTVGDHADDPFPLRHERARDRLSGLLDHLEDHQQQLHDLGETLETYQMFNESAAINPLIAQTEDMASQVERAWETLRGNDEPV